MSKRLLSVLIIAGTAFLAAAQAGEPSLSEVRDLLRAKLDGVEESDIDEPTMEGLLKEVAGRAMLLKEAGTVEYKDEPGLPLIAQATLFEDQFAYIRVGRFAPEVASELTKKIAEFNTATKVKGLVIDVRFSSGRDFSGAAAVADLFLDTAQPLLHWKGTAAKSTAKANPVRLPLVVLVNQATRGVGEVLAGIVREKRLGVVIGQTTAGQALELTGFKLSSSQTLMIATAQVRLGSGKILLGGNCRPDITVQVPEPDELAFLTNPYALPGVGPEAALSLTNRGARPRMNEAQLVRQRREGLDADSARENPVASASARPLVRDPALARGLDLLKGLSLLKPSRPS